MICVGSLVSRFYHRAAHTMDSMSTLQLRSSTNKGKSLTPTKPSTGFDSAAYSLKTVRSPGRLKTSSGDEDPNQSGTLKPSIVLELSSSSSDNGQGFKSHRMREMLEDFGQDAVYELEMRENPLLKPKKILEPSDKQLLDSYTLMTDNLIARSVLAKNNEEDSLVDVELFRKKTVLNEVQAEEDCKIYKDGRWTKTKLMLMEDTLAFFEFSFKIDQLMKIKIIPTGVSRTKAENIIKVQAGQSVHLFCLSLDKKSYNMPTAFFIFAKLIETRLCDCAKTASHEWQTQFESESHIINDSYVYGNIYKKSQILGHWDRRFVVIKKNGIYSYRDSQQDEQCSFLVNSLSIKYLWTRFDMLNGCLIVKIKHGLQKTQFAIPVGIYSAKTTKNWLYSFYRVMPAPVVTAK